MSDPILTLTPIQASNPYLVDRVNAILQGGFTPEERAEMLKNFPQTINGNLPTQPTLTQEQQDKLERYDNLDFASLPDDWKTIHQNLLDNQEKHTPEELAQRPTQEEIDRAVQVAKDGYIGWISPAEYNMKTKDMVDKNEVKELLNTIIAEEEKDLKEETQSI